MPAPRRRQRHPLRLAVATDARELAAFERQAFRGYYAAHRFTREQFERYLAQPHTIAYVATDDGRIIGYSLGIVVQRTPPVARLLSVAVDPKSRGRGLGRALLTRFLAAARRRGAHAAYLETATRNTAALALFRRHGFAPIRRLPDYYGAAVEGIRMRRAW